MGHPFYKTRERLLAREFDDRPFRLLDVGAGNDSPVRIKSVFPTCEYHGVDRDLSYNLSRASLKHAARFYTMDLTMCRFESIPDAFYDVILFSHVVEPLFNGERVLQELVAKLKRGGTIYVEWPSQGSLFLPSMRGTLNFCDDATHVRFFARHELARVLEKAGCAIEQLGRCRNVWRLLAWPAIVLKNYQQRGYFEASDFWELLGFADFIWARKTQ